MQSDPEAQPSGGPVPEPSSPDAGSAPIPPADASTPPAPPAADAPSAPLEAPAPAPALAPAPPRRAKASTQFLLAVTLVSLVADLASKGWAKSRLSNFDPKAHGLHKVEIIKGHVDFIFAQNPGGAWSFLRGLPDSLRRPFFLVVSAAAIVFIVSIYQRIHGDQRLMKWGLPLALGGAMGNLVDRIRYGWVVDFIDFSMRWGGRDHHWPTFNVADIAIVIGVGLMAIDMLRARGVNEQPAEVPS